jgi:RNA polymerase sigma-70 factor, ECF subfamily
VTVVFLSIEEIIRQEGGRVMATLCRMTGSLDLAEDAWAEAVVEALRRWPVTGLPQRPGAWLTTVAKRKGLDILRREQDRSRREEMASALMEPDEHSVHSIRDDQLRLIFTCCHPALAIESRVALALRVLCGLTTAEIAQAFLLPEPTIGKRITRAKSKIAANRIPYRVPPDHELPDRVRAVLAVVEVMFTTGHHAPSGATLTRVELMDEAVRLSRLLVDLMPDEPECLGLLGLLLATRARATTRTSDDGIPVLLADADRSRWDTAATEDAVRIVEHALRKGRPGPYQLKAAISCLHSCAVDIGSTDWPQIVQLYRMLEVLEPSVAVRVNRAVAEAEVAGPEAGLALLDDVDAATSWHLFHTARADLLRRTGDLEAAAGAYRLALDHAGNDVDRAFLAGRLEALG